MIKKIKKISKQLKKICYCSQKASKEYDKKIKKENNNGK
jgi:hypothetical protein